MNTIEKFVKAYRENHGNAKEAVKAFDYWKLEELRKYYCRQRFLTEHVSSGEDKNTTKILRFNKIIYAISDMQKKLGKPYQAKPKCRHAAA